MFKNFRHYEDRIVNKDGDWQTMTEFKGGEELTNFYKYEVGSDTFEIEKVLLKQQLCKEEEEVNECLRIRQF